MAQAKRKEALCLLILLVLWVLFFWRYLTPIEMDRLAFPQGDFTNRYTYRAFAYRELIAGRFPLWMPCVLGGYPLQADPQSALFYPPALLNYLVVWAMGFPRLPLRALEVEAMLHVLAASLFTYAFLRKEVGEHVPALVGSLAFAYGGYLTGYPLLQIAVLEGGIWLPLALLGARGLAKSGKGRYFLLTALAVAASVLAGNPQTYTYVIYTTLGYYAWLAWRGRLRPRTAALRMGLALGAGLALCAVQLLPSLEYARLSTRARIPFEEAGTGFPPEDVLQLALTGLVSHWQPLYVGLFPLVLAWLAVTLGRREERIFWLGLALTGLVLSLGKNAFGFELAYLVVPGYRLFRCQERHAFLVSFALAMLAGHGSRVFLHPLGKRARAVVKGTARWLGWGLPLVFLLLGVATYLHRLGIDPSDSGELPRRLGILFMALAGCTALLQLRLHNPRSLKSLAFLTLALVVFDLFSLNRHLDWARPYEPFPLTPLLRPMVEEKGPFRIQDDYRLPGQTACMHGLDDVGGIVPIKPAHYAEFLDRAPEDVRWKLLGVRYVVTWRKHLFTREGKPAKARLVYQEGEGEEATYLHRLEGELRWAFVVRELHVARNKDELYSLLASPDFDPWQTAVVEESVPLESVAVSGEDEVSLVERSSQRVVLRVKLGSPGLLVVSEAYYPGWRAYVNGKRTRLYRADGVLRAVLLPAGEAEVEFRYEPLSLRLGALISLLALLSLPFLGRLKLR